MAPVEPQRRASTRIRRESAAKREAEEPLTPTRPAKIQKPASTVKHEAVSETYTGGRGKRKSTGATTTSKAQKATRVHGNGIEDVSAPAPKIEVLPSKLRDGEPIPTLAAMPSSYGDEYQTIIESGVIKAALARSRKRWVTEGVFEKYWTKPEKGLSKKKRAELGLPPPPPKNPMDKVKPGEKMGTCKLVVEPHIFDVTLYEVRHYLPQSHRQNYRQYNGISHGPQPYQPQHNPHTPHPPPPVAPSHPQHPSSIAAGGPEKPPVQPHPPAPRTNAPSAPRPKGNNASSPSSGDPVIQMLAQRASVNPELKGVMKIVANGQANQEQLRYFQRHIDELHKIVGEQKRREEREKKQRQQQQAAALAHPQGVEGPYGAQAPHYGHTAAYQQQVRYPPPPPQYNVKAVLIEFNDDPMYTRYLFPPRSMIEYGPGFQSCTVSFLVPIKASEAEDQQRYLQIARDQPLDRSEKFEDAIFWQPVTVQFRVNRSDSQVLSSFGRAVQPATEVATWMAKMLDGQPDESPKKLDDSAATAIIQNPGATTESPVPSDRPIVKVEKELEPTAPLSSGRRRAEDRVIAVRLPREDMAIEIA